MTPEKPDAFRLPEGADPAAATRKTLLLRMRDLSDEESWQEFFDQYWKLIYSVARRSGLSEADARDVVQETLVAVARNIGTFKYDPSVRSFKNWLLQFTRWRILDRFRKRRREPWRDAPPSADPARTATVERIPAPASVDSVWEEEWAQTIYEAALLRVKNRVRSDHFQAFNLVVRQGWTAGNVAQFLGTSTAQVYLLKHRVSRLIRKEIQRLEKEGR